jgi:hypothetical protein
MSMPTRVSIATDKSARVASIASALFAVSLLLFSAILNVPWKASDHKLLAWWQSDSHLIETIASLFFGMCAAVLFIVVANYFRRLASEAEGGVTQWNAFAHSMADAFCSTMLVLAAMRGVIGRLVKIDAAPLPGLDVLRFSTGLNYALYNTGAMAALALSILAMSIVVIRTQILPRWVGVVGIICSAVILAAVAALLGSLAVPVVLVWAMSMAVALWRQPPVA